MVLKYKVLLSRLPQQQYQEETNLRAYILLDISRSMVFKSDNNLDKLSYGIHLTAALSYILLHQEDSVGLAIFDTEVRKFIPPRAQLGHFSNITDTIENITPHGDTSISSTLDNFGKYLKRRGLIIFISDLFDNPEDVIRSLKYFRYKHHDVIVLQIIDPVEKDFSYKGSVTFESLEKPYTEIYSEPEVIQKKYQELFAMFIEKYQTSFRQAGIDYCLLTTNIPLELGLGSFLTKRR